MNKLILIEGIPGSGKTTTAKKIAESLSGVIKTNLYIEGQLHPADLGWCACIPMNAYERLLDEYPQYAKIIEANTEISSGIAVVAYAQFPIKDNELFKRLESCEVYDGRADLETFSYLHINRWGVFSAQAEGQEAVNIFECAFLQNHINELLLFHQADEEAIEKHLLALLGTVNTLNPVLIYLNQPDVRKTIETVSDARRNSRGERDWMERVIGYIETSPYGRAHGLNGFDGMVRYFEIRKETELRMIERLPVQSYIVSNAGELWENVWKEVSGILKDLYSVR